MTTRDGPAPMPVLGRIVKSPSDTARDYVFAPLESEWRAVASGAPARRALRAWATAAPALDGFASPAEVVGALGRLGDSTRSHALLAGLLVVADVDELAAQAVLQAIVPGLRRAAQRRWKPTTPGPWAHADDVAADAVSAAWAAIRVHAGRRHDRPAAVIIRAVEGRLRRTHDTWRRQAACAAPLLAGNEPSQSGLDAARTIEEQAADLIADAMRAEVVNPAEARLLFATGVLGHTVALAGRMIGASGNDAYRHLHQARASLRPQVEDSSDVDEAARMVVGRSPRTRRSPRFPTATASPQADADRVGSAHCPSAPLLITPLHAAGLVGVSRSKVYALVKAGEVHSVSIGACRRIPHCDLVDYLERRRQEDGPLRRPPTDATPGRTALEVFGDRQASAGPESRRRREAASSGPIVKERP